MTPENEYRTTHKDKERETRPPNQELILALYQQLWERPIEVRKKMEEYLENQGEPLVQRVSQAPLPTEYGDWTQIHYLDRRDGKVHTAMVYGDADNGALGDREEVLVRIHSSHRPNEIWGAPTSDDAQQLEESMKRIHEKGRGVIIYLDEEGRGNGEKGQHMQFQNMFGWEDHKIVEKRDPETNEPMLPSQAYAKAGLENDPRSFKHVAQILGDIGIKSVVVMTAHMGKTDKLIQAGVRVVGVSPVHVDTDHPITNGYHMDQQKNGYLPKQATVFNAK